ncbi:MAG: glutamate--tRNA ligase [Candidatus Ratteibacteria bacterium]
MIRVRFAPSPTGPLHVGNVRTALFNYLYAKGCGGKFIIRIEDTDRERSTSEYEEAIFRDLQWLGLEWDEGPDIGGPFSPYRQTERIPIYREYAEKLLQQEKAYLCWCTKEELEERKIATEKSGGDAGYDNRCREISPSEKERFIKEGRVPSIRFRVPEKHLNIHDKIRGDVAFDTSLMKDFIIMKSDGIPTFHFAVVIDDITMKISHVIRGEDHLTNTAKHILLFEALEEKIPFFAHMSMTLGPDRSKLSKRHGATSVRAFQEAGYLPEAFFNYIALLGWGSSENQEIFSKEELISHFSIERCNKSSAIFDPTKLLWMNGLYVRKKSPAQLRDLLMPYLEKAFPDIIGKYSPTFLETIVRLEQERFKTLADAPDLLGFYLMDRVVYDAKGLVKFATPEHTKTITRLSSLLSQTEPFEPETIEEKVRGLANAEQLSPGALFHPLRFAVSGRSKGAGLFDLLGAVGKKRVLDRMTAFLETAAPLIANKKEQIQ